MTRTVVIVESRLEIALPMAALLEASGFRIVGLIVERAAALAIAEGERPDYSARIADLPLTDQRAKTCAALLWELGIPTLRMQLHILQKGSASPAGNGAGLLPRQG